MSAQIKVRGIVVDQTAMGEKDKRVVVLTREMGKIPVMAKGAKSQAGRVAPSSDLFTVSDFVLERGRTFYYIKEYELLESFYSLRNDLDRLSYASILLEMSRLFSLDGEDNSDLFNLLVQGLAAMEKPESDALTVSLTFMMRLLSDSGFTPELSCCVSCGKPYEEEGDWSFGVTEGGLLCSTCTALKTVSRKYPLRPGSVAALRFMVQAPPEKVYRFRISDQIRRELKAPIRRYAAVQAGVSLKTVEFAENMESIG